MSDTSGGLGGTTDAPIGSEPDPLEELAAREGANGQTVFVPTDRAPGTREPAPAKPSGDTVDAETGETTRTWVDDLPEDLQEYARGKGFKDPAGVLKSQRDAEANMHRLNGRLEQLESLIESGAYEGRQPPPSATEPPPAADFWEAVGNYGNWMASQIEEGQVDAHAGMTQFVSEVIKNLPGQIDAAVQSQLQGVMDDYVAPLSEESWARRRRDEASDVVRKFPEEYNRLRPRMEELVRQRTAADPEFVNRPDAIRDVFNQALAEEIERERRTGRAPTLEGGARSRRQPPSPERDAAQLLADMDAVAPRDMSGGLA